MKVFLVSIVLSCFLAASISEEEKIVWQEDRKLDWTDFRGIPNAADTFVASTNSGVSFAFSIKESESGVEVDYTVLSNFYPALSWYRPQRVNAYILAHEQTHFDISELFARKLRKKLASIEDPRQFKELADKYYNENEFERREMQRRYDEESDHSNIESKEYEWREFVKDQLKLLEAWK